MAICCMAGKVEYSVDFTILKKYYEPNIICSQLVRCLPECFSADQASVDIDE